MNVFVSNRLEKLIATLAERLRTPLQHPLMPETIVVQSLGMAKWLSLELAARHGVSANYHFPFPNAFLDEIYPLFIEDYQNDPSYDTDVITWKLFEILADIQEKEAFSSIKTYLGTDGDQLKVYQLAEKLAWTFDQYLIFRPDLVLRWEAGQIDDAKENWQALLWMHLRKAKKGRHKAELRAKLLDALNHKGYRAEALPERISIFGISYLPPYHLEILSALSRHLSVDYYYLNPSCEFWADIRSGREISRFFKRPSMQQPGLDEALLHLETGNSLLASWGAQGRDFFRLMENMSMDHQELYDEPHRFNLLHKIQSDLYRLEEPFAVNAGKEQIGAEDDSIQIHICHSPLREVETLHDALLKLFEQDRHLEPRDILVMMPDIEAYSPYIEAVFDSREPKIPFTIADRSALSVNSIAGAVMSILDIVESRYTAADVLSLLENPVIAEKFEIDAQDRELLFHWIQKTHIRWGIDETHRQSLDLPAFGQNTWRQGLDRLLAGIVFDGRRAETYEGILPFGEIESDQTLVLGRFLQFWEMLVRLREILSRPHHPEKWFTLLNQILQEFLDTGGKYQRESYEMVKVIGQFHTLQKHAQCDMDLELKVMKRYLKEVLNRQFNTARFLSGGVSFCAMLPMRSIPFNVICLLGMNTDAYPRRDRKTGFNILEHDRRPGDRSVRSDDQYLFLESLLSARKQLYISYTGLNQTDNSEVLPSVLVCELMDYLETNYCSDSDGSIVDQITTRHRLHAFSPEYFAGRKKMYCYSHANFMAAQAIVAQEGTKAPFVSKQLAGVQRKADPIEIQELIAFFNDPVRYFLEHRLCIKLPETLWEAQDESEPFEIDPLSSYLIKKELLDTQVSKANEQAVLEIKRAEGALPVGAAGDYLYDTLRQKTAQLSDDVERYLQSPQLSNLDVQLYIGEEKLSGMIDHLYEDYRMVYRPAKLKMKDYVSAWINHLILNAAAPAHYPKKSMILGEDASRCFMPVTNAMEILQKLVEYYFAGQERPLKIFSQTTWEYASLRWQKNKSPGEALQAAKRLWQGDENSFVRADSDDMACKICFSDDDPIDDEFQKMAEDIFADLFIHMEKAG